jgi:hypothetical protein
MVLLHATSASWCGYPRGLRPDLGHRGLGCDHCQHRRRGHVCDLAGRRLLLPGGYQFGVLHHWPDLCWNMRHTDRIIFRLTSKWSSSNSTGRREERTHYETRLLSTMGSCSWKSRLCHSSMTLCFTEWCSPRCSPSLKSAILPRVRGCFAGWILPFMVHIASRVLERMLYHCFLH